jgi:hypothetical protein
MKTPEGQMGESQTEIENRDKHGNELIGVMENARNFEGFQGKTVKELFGDQDDKKKREFINQLSVEQYIGFIVAINGILRGKSAGDSSMDGVGVTAAGFTGAHIFPHDFDKKELITQTWLAAQEMNRAGRELDEIAMLAGSLLVEIHPFADGNGRTSRVVYLLIKDGFSEERLQAVLGYDGRFEFDMALSKIYLDELFEQKYGRSNQTLNPADIHEIFPDKKVSGFGQLRFPEAVSREVAHNLIQAGRNDYRILISALLEFFRKHKDYGVEKFIEKYGVRNVFLFQELISTITAEQISEIEQIYWGVKKKYTAEMIDIFVNPDKSEYKITDIGDNGEEIRMIDYFKKRIVGGVTLL